MMKFEQIPSLPTPQDYRRGVIQLTREYDLTSAEAIDNAVEKRRRLNYSFAHHFGRIAELGGQLERIETTGAFVDPNHSMAKSFRQGAAFGTFLVPKVHADIVPIDTILPSRPPVILPENLDRSERQRSIAEHILDDGMRGIAKMGSDAEELIEELESRVISDVTKQHFFRTGCGLIMLSARIAHQNVLSRAHQQDLDQFQASVNTLDETFNWDQAFKNLFGSDTN